MQDAETTHFYYDILQLSPGSSRQQIQAQYRRLAKQFHPDRNPHRREWAEERLRVLNEAYHALANANALSSASERDRASAPSAPAAAVEPAATRPYPARRALRYVVAVSLVCGVSVAYSNWSQTLQSAPWASTTSAARMRAAPSESDASAPTALGTSGASAPMTAINSDNSAPIPPIIMDNPAPVAPAAARDTSAAPAPPALAAGDARLSDASADSRAVPVPTPSNDAAPETLALQFSQQNARVNQAVAQATRVVSHVNGQFSHVPQSRRPQRAEQLAADTLELARLQRFVRGGLRDLRAPTSADLYRTQVADLQMALFQMQKQAHLVRADLAAFPAK